MRKVKERTQDHACACRICGVYELLGDRQAAPVGLLVVGGHYGNSIKKRPKILRLF